MRLMLISCEIFYREICASLAKSINQVDVDFLPKGLHDVGPKNMMPRIQEVIDRVDADRYEAILLGYGLCNNGIAGLTASALPIVIPRAHDCITLFLGDRERYQQYFNIHPGTYFMTTGWLERGDDNGELKQLSIQRQMGMDLSYEELVARYGEDNAQYLYDTLCKPLHNYNQFTFIEMGVEPDDRFERQARAEADKRGCAFEKVVGSLLLFRKLVDGEWDERDFLVLRPGNRVTVRLNEGIIAAEPADSPVNS
jgi:Protein of unknown function (DUF1638)